VVGNDVVDLDDPPNATAHLRERFVARVCNEVERAALEKAADPRTLLWSFFAAKEAVFKVVAKLGAPPPFAHRLFAIAPDLRRARWGELAFELRVRATSGWVHAVAGGIDEEHVHGVAPVSNEDAGVAARRLLRRAVARRIGRDETELEVVRAPRPGSWDGFAPPELLLHGRPTSIDVSLSHDGRFVAYAAHLCGRDAHRAREHARFSACDAMGAEADLRFSRPR